MKDFCFGNNSYNLKCKLCNIRYYSTGEKKFNVPKVDINNNILTIEFGERVHANEFSSYFGGLQDIINMDNISTIIIDISNTNYMNQFCISKLLLTLHQTIDKEITIILPSSSMKNKMLRFFYNLGILDYIFNCNKYKILINKKIISNYEIIYDFNNCYDKAIYPFHIFQTIKNNNDYKNQVEEYINDVINLTSTYFTNSNKKDMFIKINDRLYLYLYEIVDNIFEHAYDQNIIFSISITNNYFPPYMRSGKNNTKFYNRIDRLQKEVPLSIYGDIQDRFFGSINLFVDDIGKSMANTYTGHYQQIYKQIFIEGITKRSKGKTPINGLKLIGDQIANNNDILWVHDDKYWVNCAFWENSSIVKIDESISMPNEFNYTHKPIQGMTYDIMINLAKNSIAKKRTYENYGSKLDLSIEEIHNIFNNPVSLDNVDTLLVIDLLNIKNLSKSFKSELSKSFKYLLFRPRAVRKNKQRNEMFNRIFNNLPKKHEFNEFIIFDLNQTTLFQMRAVIETEDVSAELISHNVDRVILISEECWVFVCELINNKYLLSNTVSISYVKNSKKKLLFFLKNIIQNDRNVLNSYLKSNNEYIIYGNIKWEDIPIRHYLDIEQMLGVRYFFDLIYKSLLRVSGMLNESQKIVFMEYFMENLFGSYVNEYKDNAIQKIYCGSVLFTGNTEKNFVQNDDQRFYLFKHKASNISGNKYFFIFDYPEVTNNKSTDKFRRVKNSNNIEKYLEESDEYKLYFTDIYKNNIKKLDIKIGYLSNGLIEVVKNKILYEAFLEFVIEILKIELKKYELINIKIDQNLNDLYNTMSINFKEKLENSFSHRDIEEKIFINRATNKKTYNILIIDNISMIDFLEIKKVNPINMYITIFNSIKFDARFDKIIDLGYVPFIPLYIGDRALLIDSNNINNFVFFSKSLNSTYRHAIQQYIDGGALNFGNDLSKQILASLDRLRGSDDNFIETNILLETIMSCIGIVDKQLEITNNLFKSIYNSLILLIKAQHSLTYTSRLDNSEVVRAVLENYMNLNCNIPDSVAIFFQIVIIFFMDINTSEIIKLIKDCNLFSKFSDPNCHLIKIIIAKLCSGINNMVFERELNEIFVSNDIALYYNMLYQNLFNNHGSIHDSILNKFSKSIVESNGKIAPEKIEEFKAVTSECFSILRLTKPYNETDEKIVNLENELKKYMKDFQNCFLQISGILDQVTELSKSRFIILNKDNYSRDCKEFIISIINKRNRKNAENLDCDFEIKQDYFIFMNELIYDDNYKKQNIIFYNDTYMIEEIAYLFDNAIRNSTEDVFSIENNEDKQNNIWIICTLNKEKLVIKFYNGLKDKFENVLDRIYSKKRIGKTHLEKFNIHVSYNENPPNVINNKISVIETKIEIPYFY